MRLLPTREEIDASSFKRCSCYDEDCAEVTDPMACYLGGWGLGLADGYCPLLLPPPPQEQE